MGASGGNATDDMAYMRSKGVTYESFSPLCGPCDGTDAKELNTGKLVTDIGKKHATPCLESTRVAGEAWRGVGSGDHLGWLVVALKPAQRWLHP